MSKSLLEGIGVKFFYLFFPIILFLSTGFAVAQDIPVDVDRVNMKLADDEIAITFFSLPSGEATIIQHANAGNIMVNTGGPLTRKDLENLLYLYNIHSLNAIILTKNHSEYNSNLDWVIQKFHVKEIIIGKNSNLPSRKKVSHKNTVWKQNEHYEILPNLIITVLHDNSDHLGKKGMDLLFKYGKHHILYMSTVDKTIEYELVKQNLSDVNILKVADFALAEGTSKVFLNHVDPQVAIIFKKKGNLPSQDILNRLQDAWIDIYQTYQYGNISIKCSYDHYEIITLPLNDELYYK